MNIMTVHKGLAYVLQYVAPIDKYAEHTDMVHDIAKTMLIEALPHRSLLHALGANASGGEGYGGTRIT